MASGWDAIVVGLGAMGSATLRALSRRGLRVVGADRFEPPHTNGSSHGESRIIREAYFEDPSYVPLVQRAYLLWEEIERETGKSILGRTGGVMIGPRDGVLVSGALRSAEAHRLPHEVLDAQEIQRRFPAFRPKPDWVGVWEPNDGVLKPEVGIAAMLETARRHKAAVRTHHTALSWKSDGSGVVVETTRGTLRGEKLVLSAGAWMPRLVAMPLSVTRQVLFWFEPIGVRNAHDWGVCPISIWEHGPGQYFYSFPRSEQGVKVALHRLGAGADPDHLDREVRPEEIAEIRALVQTYMPFASGPLTASVVCMYTNTPDTDFIVDRHPQHENVIVLSACSGHGFKFAPAIGEAVSDLMVEGWTRHDLSRFAATRFAPPVSAEIAAP